MKMMLRRAGGCKSVHTCRMESGASKLDYGLSTVCISDAFDLTSSMMDG